MFNNMTNLMKKKIRICLIMAIMMLSASFIACEKNEIDSTLENKESVQMESNQVLEKFAKTLAIVLKESKESRKLIKVEAAKKINYDYDVLYMLVKDLDLGEGRSLEDLMLEHMNADDLYYLTESFPTLTVFIPSLPENSFSCESWNIETEIPDVAIRSINNTRTYCFNALGHEYFLEANEIPGYPIIVLKTNERIKVSSNEDNSIALRSSTNPNIQFEFIDEIFDNVSQKIETRRGNIDDNLNKARESFNVFPDNTIGWQRDYVYYGLTRETDKGPFDLRYKDHIVGFQLRGNIDGALNKISDQNEDPRLIDRYGWFEMRRKNLNNNTTLTSWTDGEFEFEVIFKIVSKTLVDNAHSIRFRCAPEQLFRVGTKNKIKGALWWKKIVYQITDMDFLYLPVQIPLIEWNLENYGASMEISISEYDLSETITIESSSSSEFATNFTFEPNFGEKVKVGLKFGATTKETHSSKITTVRTLKSDELGSVIVNFGDEIIMSNDTYRVNFGSDGGGAYPKIIPDYNKKYFTDYYQIHVAPVYTGK